MKILVINGPNLNILGKRNREIYGLPTLFQIKQKLNSIAKKWGCKLIFFQSNHEGKIIDFLQKKAAFVGGILINPGALTHYGYSLRDALVDTNLPVVEVHLSDISKREKFRNIDVFDGIVLCKITGLKEQSYLKGLEKLISILKSQKE